MSAGVIVVGSLNLDMVVISPRIPRPGENIHARGFQMVPGGKGANQAVACHRLGSPTRLLACAGSDQFAGFLIARIEESGVSASLIKRTEEASTGVALIVVEESTGINTIVVDPGANMSLAVKDLDVLDSCYRTAGIALFQLEIPLEVVAEGARRARERGLTNVLDAGPPRHVDASVLREFDVVSPNEKELEALTGKDVRDTETAAEAAQVLMDYGARAVVVKMGGRGAILVDARGAWHFPPFRVKALDSTGAGDAFTAGLAVALGGGCDLNEAVQFANAAGALAITAVGALPSMPYRERVQELMSAHTPEVIEI